MPHSFGMRARTRHMFSRSFKNKGMIPLTTYLKIYKVGDIVDIKANAAQQKGMPHKFYHGRTGIVYNVSPTSVGVIVYKVVGNRYLEKRVNLRIEHVKVRLRGLRTDAPDGQVVAVRYGVGGGTGGGPRDGAT